MFALLTQSHYAGRKNCTRYTDFTHPSARFFNLSRSSQTLFWYSNPYRVCKHCLMNSLALDRKIDILESKYWSQINSSNLTFLRVKISYFRSKSWFPYFDSSISIFLSNSRYWYCNSSTTTNPSFVRHHKSPYSFDGN